MDCTREMTVDFRRTKNKSDSISIKGKEVKVVEEFKYLCVYLDNKMEWRCNTDAVYKKGQSRLYFLQAIHAVFSAWMALALFPIHTYCGGCME